MGGERGYTLVEMVIVMMILGVVITGLTTIFVSGSNAELALNRRFQAQQQARQALDAIRTDLHCATAAQVSGMWLKISEPNCQTTNVTWCPLASTTLPTRFALYRTTNTTASRCSSSDTLKTIEADDLVNSTGLWTFSAPDGYLELIAVDFKVSANTATNRDVFELKDALVARNSWRCSATSPATTCPSTDTHYQVSP